MKRCLSIGLASLLCACSEAPPDTRPTPLTSDVTPERPPANPLRNAYFGDLHVHTGNSFDAFIFNVKAEPDEAYRYAKGEAIRHPGRFDITLDGPTLDFYAVTDHGEYLGILRAMKDKTNPLSKTALAKDMSFIKPEKLRAAFGKISVSTRSGQRIPEIYDQDHMNNVWKRTVEAAGAHNDPGIFTAFAGYEFSSVKARDPLDQSVGGNLHRNVIFQDEAPEQLFTTLDSTNPEDLWTWMDKLRAQDMDALAIPHNSNVSDGHMFAGKTYDGDDIDNAYAEQRIRNEPLAEITQVKGTSEVHPSQAPHDELADFEVYENLLNTETAGVITGSYIREALASGLAHEVASGANPFKFGFIGSSDTHVAGSGFTERVHWGKMGFVDGKPKQRGSVPKGAKTWAKVKENRAATRPFGKWSASGLAGVWAEENTREALFGALRRKETFATSGPRISVRFFAGPGLDESLLSLPDMIEKAYAGGVPMGGEIMDAAASPNFLVWAARDPMAAPLQRLQIVKTWHANGAPHSKVFDVACSSEALNETTHRCADNGARVDTSTCKLTDGSGQTELKTLWQDPEFKPGAQAAYYVRVIENPTCRWSTWDAIKAGTPPNPLLPLTLQERAWSSPIWVSSTQKD